MLALTIRKFVLCLLIAGTSSLLQAAEVNDVRMWRAPDHTRLVFDLSAAVEYELFTLNNPDRVVIDIANSNTLNPLNGLDFTESPIRAIRTGPRNNNDLRIVLDLAASIRPESFILAPNSEFGDRLVVDLYDTQSRAFSNSSVITPAPVSTD